MTCFLSSPLLRAEASRSKCRSSHCCRGTPHLFPFCQSFSTPISDHKHFKSSSPTKIFFITTYKQPPFTTHTPPPSYQPCLLFLPHLFNSPLLAPKSYSLFKRELLFPLPQVFSENRQVIKANVCFSFFPTISYLSAPSSCP